MKSLFRLKLFLNYRYNNTVANNSNITLFLFPEKGIFIAEQINFESTKLPCITFSFSNLIHYKDVITKHGTTKVALTSANQSTGNSC